MIHIGKILLMLKSLEESPALAPTYRHFQKGP